MILSVANKAIRNMFFSGVRLAITAGATVCTSAIIARTLGPANTGVYGYTLWLVGALGVLANIGLPAALTKYVSEYIGRRDTATASQLGKRLLLTQLVVALGVSGLTACFILLRTPYRSIIGLAAVMILPYALQQGLVAALAGVQRFDRIALISLYVALAQVASVGIAAIFHSGVLGMLWATLAGLAVGTWLYYRAVDELLLKLPALPSNPLSETPDVFRRIRRFSLTISYVLLLDMIVWQRSEVLFLKWYSTLPQIAFYTLAYSIATKVSEIASSFSSTLLPLYSESYGRNGLQEVGPVYVKALKYVQMVMVPLCLLGVAVAKPLVYLIYGPNYLPLVLPLQILLASLAFTSMGVVGSPLLVGTERQSFIAKYGTVVAILNVALDLILIPKHGALGAAVANCTAQVAGVLGGTIYVIRYIRTRFPWRTTATVYSAAIISVAPAGFCSTWGQAGTVALAGSVAVGALLYVGLIVAAGELGKRDFELLKGAFLTKIVPSKRFETSDLA
jgi:O-antigen/teichoic acid export membrane protein